MATITNESSLQTLTRCPLEEVVVKNSTFGEVTITTPHKGKIILEYNSKGKVETKLIDGQWREEKENISILQKIREIDKEAINFLFNKWLSK